MNRLGIIVSKVVDKSEFCIITVILRELGAEKGLIRHSMTCLNYVLHKNPNTF